METPANKILTVPVQQLNLSEECKNYLIEQGLSSIKDFIQAGWGGQKEKESFNLQYFNEVVRHLDDNGLLHMMEGK